MLVTSSQSSTQRPLGLSVEELFALDRQYHRIEQQQQHLAQLQAQHRLTTSNLNRLASRSLDLISSPPPPPPASPSNLLTVLPSLEIHGHGYTNRLQSQPSSVLNYPRSHSIDHFRYLPPPPPPPLIKHIYPQRSAINNGGHQQYQPKYKTYLQQPITSPCNTSLSGNGFMYDLPVQTIDYSDNRSSCKLRRQQPLRRESSRRIVVRPIVHRRREPSISSSCESLDERCSPTYQLPVDSTISNESVSCTPSISYMEEVIEDLPKDTKNLIHPQSTTDSSSDDSEVNLYEMRVPIGRTYDTSDISVQLEGPKVLIYCHTIEPTDKRGNYRKHELKTELFIPDVVDDETIVSYLTEDGELIVEGKYHQWAWKEIKKKRHIEKQELNISTSPINSTLPSTKNDGGSLEQERIPSPYASNNNNNNNNSQSMNSTMHRIEKLDNNRTVIHVGEPTLSRQQTDTRSVSDIINRFNTLNKTPLSNIWDGQYSFTTDNPPILIYHLRLSLETLMDEVRIQSDPKLNILKIFIEQQEKNSSDEQQQNKVIIRSTSRICRLPRDHTYDYTRLRVNFLKDNFIRIEIPTID